MAHSQIFRNAPRPRSQTAGHRGLKQGAKLRRGGGIRARGKFQASPGAIAASSSIKRGVGRNFTWNPVFNSHLVGINLLGLPAGHTPYGEHRFPANPMCNAVARTEAAQNTGDGAFLAAAASSIARAVGNADQPGGREPRFLASEQNARLRDPDSTSRGKAKRPISSIAGKERF
jgi:hypothetical protein